MITTADVNAQSELRARPRWMCVVFIGTTLPRKRAVPPHHRVRRLYRRWRGSFQAPPGTDRLSGRRRQSLLKAFDDSLEFVAPAGVVGACQTAYLDVHRT